MSVAKEPNKNTWYAKFRYKDWQGNVKQKKKIGFKTKREAQEWEREFLEGINTSPDIKFETLCNAYLEDIRQRLKLSTVYTQEKLIGKHILPYFKGLSISEITPLTVKKWQQGLIKQGYSPIYLKTMHIKLATIFHFANKFYSLKSNPATIAGNFSVQCEKHTDFWTIDEFNRFVLYAKQPYYIMFFYLLFYSGCRLGEVMALEWSDIDFAKRTISITKTYYNPTKTTTSPKTASSSRVVTMPKFIMAMLKEYQQMFYDKDVKLFPITATAIRLKFDRMVKHSGVKRIRIHDLRHSHASLLVSLNVPMKVISERLGHSSIATTMDIYSHLYNKDKDIVADMLDTQF